MYIKIKNGIVTDWSNNEFKGSTFVDIDYQYYNEHLVQFAVVNGVLTDIADTVEYQSRMAEKERARLNSLILSKRTFWLTLLEFFNKEKADVITAIEALEVDLIVKKKALIELDEASVFERSNPLFEQLAPLLGLTSADIDDVFEKGNK